MQVSGPGPIPSSSSKSFENSMWYVLLSFTLVNCIFCNSWHIWLSIYSEMTLCRCLGQDLFLARVLILSEVLCSMFCCFSAFNSHFLHFLMHLLKICSEMALWGLNLFLSQILCSLQVPYCMFCQSVAIVDFWPSYWWPIIFLYLAFKLYFICKVMLLMVHQRNEVQVDLLVHQSR